MYFSRDGDKEANMTAHVGVGACELDKALKEI